MAWDRFRLSEYKSAVRLFESVASDASADALLRQPYTPIAAAAVYFPFWETMLFDAITFPAMRVADLNRDCYLGADELYVAMRAGLIDMRFPAYQARFRMISDPGQRTTAGDGAVTADGWGVYTVDGPPDGRVCHRQHTDHRVVPVRHASLCARTD